MSTENFRATPPAPAEPRPYRFPDVHRHELPNGMKLLLAVRRSAPLMTVRAVVHSGAEHDPLDQPGIAVFTAEMLEEGAAGRGSMEIAGEVAELGAALYCGADWDASLVSIDALGRHLDSAVSITRDLVRFPEFPPDELERMRKERLTAILQQKDDPSVIAAHLFNRFVFGKTSYGNPSTGTEESIRGLTRAEVESFYARHYAPNNTSLLVTGDIDPDQVIRSATEAFGSWERREQAVHKPPQPEAHDATRVYLVDRPGSVQSEIRLGHVGVARDCEDYFPLMVMNAILGGVFTSRLNLNLREKHGYTYGIRSSFSMRRSAGPFVISTAVRNEVTSGAIREILSELDLMREGELSAEELAVARDYLEGVFPATVQSAHDLSARLQEMELYGLPHDYFDHYRERIAAVDAEEIRRVANKYLDPARAAIIVVGKAEDVEAPLRALEHPVGLFDIEGNAVR